MFKHTPNFEVQPRFADGVLSSFFSTDVLERMKLNLGLDFEILNQGLVKILKLKFYGEADVWLRF